MLVLLVFAWLVSKHHQKLYAPLDYKSDEAFIAASLREARPTLAELDAKIEEKVHTVLNSNEMISAIQAGGDVESRLRYAANQITSQIRKSSFIRIKASEFTKRPADTFEFPFDAFATFGNLTNEVYFRIKDYVKPYEYGYTWVLKDEPDGRVFQSLRMLTNTPPGVSLMDFRTLDMVGISPGMSLLVSKPDAV